MLCRVMENTYVIAWKSKMEPRWGQGRKLFTREDAEALADELNQEYPAFTHEALDIAPAQPAIIDLDFVPAAADPEAVAV